MIVLLAVAVLFGVSRPTETFELLWIDLLRDRKLAVNKLSSKFNELLVSIFSCR